MQKRKSAARKTRPAAAKRAAITFLARGDPSLAKGEIPVGILLDEQGNPSHNVILLPEERDGLTWAEAVAWAKKQGGELPTRPEAALLYANAKSQFKPGWPCYWTGEQLADDAAYAWYQTFSYGYQYWRRKDNELRARAVRRVPIR